MPLLPSKEKSPTMSMLDAVRWNCAGLTRREILTAGTLTFLGGCFHLPNLLAAEASRSRNLRAGKAKSVILLFLHGGAATQDMFDLKPDAPVGIRGEFRPIATNVPGTQICEHLPQSAQWMHRTALIRSVTHAAGCHNTLTSYTGSLQQTDQIARESDPPSMGSVFEYLNAHRTPHSVPSPSERGDGVSGPDKLPAYVYMPNWLAWGQAQRRPGPYAGFLGKRYDAFTTECSPYTDPGLTGLPERPTVVRGTPHLPTTELPDEITVDRFNQRVGLLEQVDMAQRRLHESGVIQSYNEARQRALGLLGTSKLREAFDLSKESSRVVERYGNTLFGNSALLARRLVERGVRFVNVSFDLYETPALDPLAWDTHLNNFVALKETKLPVFDQVYSALLEDLEARGLLDETLVFVTTEMGRTPRINDRAGRDNWTYCYSNMLAGAGIKGGMVLGASDGQAAYVRDRPVSPTEICATIYELLVIGHDMVIHDRFGRPYHISRGAQPVRELMT